MTGAAALQRAAETAVAAPSIFNTQPWRWETERDALRLWADRARQLVIADPDGRLLTISCGAALHYARVALAAAGCAISVERLPDPDDTDVLAEIHLRGSHRPTETESRLREAIAHQHTDRRAFMPDPVALSTAAELAAAAQAEGARLLLVDKDQLARRPMWSDGRPHGAQYALISTDEDTALQWLRAGEALSAVLLRATAAGLSTAPISDVTELAVTRDQLRRMLSGIGIPQLAVRIGHAPSRMPTFTPSAMSTRSSPVSRA